MGKTAINQKTPIVSGEADSILSLASKPWDRAVGMSTDASPLEQAVKTTILIFPLNESLKQQKTVIRPG